MDAQDGFDLLGQPLSMSQAAVAWHIPVNNPRCTGSKIFQCPIHDQMRFDALSLSVIDTPEYQRLRQLQQLGLTSYVYPGAHHTRFDHSLGVGHLAQKWAEHIFNLQQGELHIDKKDIACVTLAGLCHDLGHGPFSHVFDRELLRVKGISDWEHEDMSCHLFDRIVNQLPERADGSVQLSEDDVARIKRMINVERAGQLEMREKKFLFDIVANKKNGIDVDKFDYLARDSYHCGVKISFDHKRTMAFSKVVGQEICFRASQYEDIFELFHSRQRMHRKVYTHRKAKSVEFMVVDAMLAADEFLNLTEMIRIPSEFIRLDDSLLKMIENWGHNLLGFTSSDKERSLQKAQGIIQRLRNRDLYRYVNEVKIPRAEPRPNESTASAEEHYKDQLARITREANAANLLHFHKDTSVRVEPSDIIFNTCTIDYAAKGKNPMDKVLFFDHADDTTYRRIDKNDVSHMFMEVFQENTLRLYSRNSDVRVVEALQVAFEKWQKVHLPTQNLVTPRKTKGPRPAGENGGNSSQEEHERKRPRVLLTELDRV